MFDRKDVVVSNAVALGCSHTFGVGVEPTETWSYLLNARNFGEPGCSTDFIVRNAPDIINKYQPTTIYVLYPDWSRFEIIDNGVAKQSLPTDWDRIKYMNTHNDQWLRDNFKQKAAELRSLCSTNNIRLIDITLYDLIPYIDHADRWPRSQLGHHYSPVWHQWVADIFKQTKQNQELAYE